jgi:hypothetical protein
MKTDLTALKDAISQALAAIEKLEDRLANHEAEASAMRAQRAKRPRWQLPFNRPRP